MKDLYGNNKTKKLDEFHQTRSLFVVIDGEICVGVNYESHLEWFIKIGLIESVDDEKFSNIVRGYYDSEGIYLYKGLNFAPIDNIDEYLSENPDVVRILKMWDLPVYNGLFVGKPGTKYKPLFSIKL